MRVLLSEFLQETNSFCPAITDRSGFTCWSNNAIASAREIDGMTKVLRSSDVEIICGPMLRAQASGPVLHSVVEEYLTDLAAELDAVGALDAVCLSMHGATQSTACDDVCGKVVQMVREKVGSDVCISVSVDLHANVTDVMYDNADSICGYQTYPHVDMLETGARAAQMCLRKLAGEKLFTARVMIPMIVPASGYSTNYGAFEILMDRARKLGTEGTLVDYSIFQMQPWLDVACAGSCVLTTAHDPETAKRCAISLAQELVSIRVAMQPKTLSPEEIIEEARKSDTRLPVIVSDFSDSPNAGAAGDNIVFLEKLIHYGPELKAAVILNDPPAVARAFACGIGNTGVFSLGGTIDPCRANAVTVEAKVRSLHDGAYLLAGPTLRGVEVSAGPTAVITTGNIDILICSSMMLTGDIQLYRHFGIEPEFYQLVLVKANTSFRVSYGPITDCILLCDTQGAATGDLASLPYRKMPRTFYPFVDITDFRADEHVSVRKM